MSIFLCEGNPFLNAYTASDLLGKGIFLSLILLSVISWTILIQKVRLTNKAKKESLIFRKSFFQTTQEPLVLDYQQEKTLNPFGIIYEVLKLKTNELFNRDSDKKKELSSDDVALLETHASSTIASLTNFLEKNLFVLSTIVTLAPFLGLLGTVYGILITFTELGSQMQATSNQAILGGLSLALTTTVLGLVNAIPALIAYNYLKTKIRDFDSEMQRFATDLLSFVELKYRK